MAVAGIEMVQLEDLVGVIRAVKRRTIDIVYDLFYSDKRVVAAVVLHYSDFSDVYRKHDPITLLFGNAYERRQIRTKSSRLMEERRLAFKDKTLDAILNMHEANMEMPYENVSWVTIRKGFLGRSLDFMVRMHPKKKISFSLKRSQVKEARRLLGTIQDKAKYDYLTG